MPMSPNRPRPLPIELPITRFRGELARWMAEISGGGSVVVTVDRRPVAVMTDFQDYDQLCYLAARQRATAVLVEAAAAE